MADLGDFTLFDIFKKKEKVYLILSINFIIITKNDIIVKINSNELTFNSSIVKDEYEPILVLIYNADEYTELTNIKFEVIYKNKILTFRNNEYNPGKKYFLTLTTLFKDDFNLFPVFYDYYKKEGVEHFFMYYNGIITKEVKNIFNKEDVTLIEWDFRYWNWKNKTKNKEQHKYQHHAQPGQMHHALYKYGKDFSEYMIFCDLDEYLHIHKNIIKSYLLKTNLDLYGFCNTWSKTLDENIPNIFPKEILISNDKFEYMKRSKNIYKVDKIKTMSIHVAHKFNTDNISSITNLQMFHFYNWSNKRRKIDSVNIKIKLIKDKKENIKNISKEEKRKLKEEKRKLK